jgi:hypothetical protein
MHDAFRYEHRSQPPLTRRLFFRRMLRHGGYAALLVAISVAIGTLGYMVFAKASFVDGFLNAAMLLGGMGPVGTLDTDAGKIFAAIFALYSGLVFLVVATLLLAPVFHRILHRFHWEARADKG